MYLLKRLSFRCSYWWWRNSHSTMYLLKLSTYSSVSFCIFNSHSTMYLLKPATSIWPTKSLINSHSTMYLLKRCKGHTLQFDSVQFTFHHVSIKTLLNLSRKEFYSQFTFHHVSIKTIYCFAASVFVNIFTFHHVSIKTKNHSIDMTRYANSHSTMYLLKHYPLFSL